MAPSDADVLAAAVNALYRIRAVEQPPDVDGFKEVWHQCAQGAELVSCVDRKGHVVRQELSLLQDYLRWTSTDGLATGSSGRAEGSKARRAGEAVILDRITMPLKVLRAKAALAGYQGTDRYLQHIQKVLTLAADGMQSRDEPTVTHIKAQGAPPPAESRRPLALWWVLGTLAVAGLGAVTGYLLTRL
jgi:hypothetical protein